MVSLLLSITFACGVFVAAAHVINVRFIAPVYDVIANLLAFTSAAVASTLLHHWAPATFAALAVLCWLVLAWRTYRALTGHPTGGTGERRATGQGLPVRHGQPTDRSLTVRQEVSAQDEPAPQTF